jgi:hypothetical protein
VIRLLIAVGVLAALATVISLAVHRRQVAAITAALTAVCVLVPTVSLGRALAADDEPLLQAGANWARNHGMGALVDRIEYWRYREPPSAEPATQLALDDGVVTVAVTAPTSTLASVPASVPAGAPAGAPTGSPLESPPSTGSTGSPGFAPAPLTPVLDDPLFGEGEWVPWNQPGFHDALWITSLRPLAAHGSVTATYVHFDPARLRAVLYAGSELPGGDDWRSQHRVEGSEVVNLVAAFNGGFRFEHIAGGYVSEGREVKPLVDGEATLAIDADGRFVIGLYGRDLVDDGTWVSLRQNLPLLVDGGRSQVTPGRARTWGGDHGGVTYVFRAALCTLPNGHVRFVSAGEVDASMMADIMVAAGCELAMQLDINGTWPQFTLFDRLGSSTRPPIVVDRRMGNPYRYLSGSKKDFIALFLRR